MTDRTPTQGPPPGSGPRTVRYADRGDGWTLAMELLTATFVWGGIGWLADRWLATAPVLMLLGFVLGNALGVYLIWVRSKDRFAQEHAELMARRARTRAAASGVVPPASGGARRPGPVPDTASDGAPRPVPTPGVVATDGAPPWSAAVPDAAVDDEIVAPIYEGDRRD